MAIVSHLHGFVMDSMIAVEAKTKRSHAHHHQIAMMTSFVVTMVLASRSIGYATTTMIAMRGKTKLIVMTNVLNMSLHATMGSASQAVGNAMVTQTAQGAKTKWDALAMMVSSSVTTVFVSLRVGCVMAWTIAMEAKTKNNHNANNQAAGKDSSHATVAFASLNIGSATGFRIAQMEKTNRIAT